MNTTGLPDRHWKIAISYASENRPKVAPIAAHLAQHISAEHILYDVFHGWDFARPNLGDAFDDYYSRSADLVVVFLSKAYPTKEWCCREMTAITRRTNDRSTMYFLLDEHRDYGAIGISTFDGMKSLDGETTRAIANEILHRSQELAPGSYDYRPFAIGHLSDLHFRFDDDVEDTDRHDPPMMRGLEGVLKDKVDCLVVSGDVTARADTNSFERSSRWLHGRMDLDGRECGLDLDGTRVPLITVPGNSDFNSIPHDSRLTASEPETWPLLPKGIHGWSLEHYKRFYCQGSAGASCVRWFRHAAGDYVVIYRMLSPPTGTWWPLSKAASLSRSAAEKVTTSQIDNIRNIHKRLLDKGSLSTVVDLPITKEHYARAAKIVVMHHPLDPHNGHLRNRRRRVERHIKSFAGMGVHAVLCGHQHEGSVAMVTLSSSRVSAANREQRDSAALNLPPNGAAPMFRAGKHLPKFITRSLLASFGLVERDLSAEEWGKQVEATRNRSITQLVRLPGWHGDENSVVNGIAEALVIRFLENLATDSRPPTEQSRRRLESEVDRLTTKEVDLLRRVADHPTVKLLQNRLHRWRLVQFRGRSAVKVIGRKSSDEGFARGIGILLVSFTPQNVILDYQPYEWDVTNRQFQGPDHGTPIQLDR